MVYLLLKMRTMRILMRYAQSQRQLTALSVTGCIYVQKNSEGLSLFSMLTRPCRRGFVEGLHVEGLLVEAL